MIYKRLIYFIRVFSLLFLFSNILHATDSVNLQSHASDSVNTQSQATDSVSTQSQATDSVNTQSQKTDSFIIQSQTLDSVSLQSKIPANTSGQLADAELKFNTAYSSGVGLISAGFVFLGFVAATPPMIISAGKKGNVGGAIALSLIGGACEISSPLLMSGGATKIERAYKNIYGIGDNACHNWTFYQVGIVFTIISKVVGLIPTTQKVLYRETETSGSMMKTTEISYSPAAGIIAGVGQFFYLINGIHAATYASKTKNEVKSMRNQVLIIPIIEGKGTLGLKVCYLY